MAFIHNIPMLVYRISRTKFADDLSGEGARLYGGRWNPKGIPCLYVASSISLAVLEFSVHVNIDELPRALSISTLKIPDSFLDLAIQDLPGDWNRWPSPASTRDLGGNLLSAQKDLVIRVPSTVIPKEFNFLVNPLHPQFKQVKLISVEDFVFDVRIKQ
jgi:RES domain-containing protein